MTHAIAIFAIIGVILLICLQCYAKSREAFQDFHQNHPRLVLNDRQLDILKEQASKDLLLQSYIKSCKQQAEALLNRKVTDYILPYAKHEIWVIREVLENIYLLGILYRLEGDERYAQRAIVELDQLCKTKYIKDYFLDISEYVHTLAIGYDWFYSYLPEEKRKKYRKAIFEVLNMDYGEAITRDNNWNIVCNGSLAIAALAVYEEDPTFCRKIIKRSVKLIPRCLKHFAPEGGWMEGAGYWAYTARYTAHTLSAMQSTLGHSFDLENMPGLAQTANFPVYNTAPSGLYFNFADVCANSKRPPDKTACIFWFAEKYDLPFCANDEHKLAQKIRIVPNHVIWYCPETKINNFIPLDKYFPGEVPVAVFRSSWSASGAMWCAVKGGYNQTPHGHLDLGNFEIEKDNIRWIFDLGSENYSLPGFWRYARNGQRWSYYRNNSFSHNVPLINGKGQDPLAKAQAVNFDSNKDNGKFVINLTEAYKLNGAEKVQRTIVFSRKNETILLRDDFCLTNDGVFESGLMTKAQVEITDYGFVLKQNQKECKVRISSNGKHSLRTEKTREKENEMKNPDTTRIIIKIDSKAEKNSFCQLEFFIK